MKQTLTFILLISSIVSFGQKNSKWQLSFQLQPELTLHQNDYAHRWTDKYMKATFSIGVASLLQYNIGKRIFLEGGIGYVNRKLNTKAFVNQSLLPPPYYDSTLLLYVTKSVSLRTFEIPIGFGVYLFKTAKTHLFVKGAFIPNFLMNAKYEANHYPAFKKNYWQGYSLVGGIGIDHRLNKKITITNCLSYSFVNTVTNDYYLFSQDERFIALPHTYLQLSAGIKIDMTRLK